MKIAIMGTHSTGKTTLAKALSEYFGLPLITEQARKVARHMGITHCDKLTENPGLAIDFQSLVLHNQLMAQIRHPGGYVSDRSSLDCYAYWLLYDLCYLKPKNTKVYRKFVLDIAGDYDLLVYCAPTQDLEDDGFRLTGDLNRVLVDDYIQQIAQHASCPILEVVGSTGQRVRQVAQTAKALACGSVK